MALTDAAITRLKAQLRRYEVADREGLVIEVQPSGRKVWRYRYRLNGKREKLTIGPYPTVGLREARDKRRLAEQQVLDGCSPASAKRVAKSASKLRGGELSTLAEVAERWIEGVLRSATKNSRQCEVYVRRDIVPRIGHLRPSEVRTQDVWTCVEHVSKRGHGQAARKVQSVIKRIFDYAQSIGLARDNPAVAVRQSLIAPTRKRARVLSHAEIKQLNTALDACGIHRAHKLAVKFLLLVPVRKGELVKAKWESINLDTGLWDIPATDSKNGAPIQHRLSNQARQIMRELHALAGGSEWVLPSGRNFGNQHLALTTLNKSLQMVEGAPKGFVLHDLRRTTRTGLAEIGVPNEVAELCLNHRPQGVAGVYDRSERLEQRTIALQRWADLVDDILESRSNVVPFGRANTA